MSSRSHTHTPRLQSCVASNPWQSNFPKAPNAVAFPRSHGFHLPATFNNASIPSRKPPVLPPAHVTPVEPSSGPFPLRTPPPPPPGQPHTHPALNDCCAVLCVHPAATCLLRVLGVVPQLDRKAVCKCIGIVSLPGFLVSGPVPGS